ncbi:MAG: glycosyltransferase family 4 protein [Rhodospirillales bacterium]|nr:glycosyltransferase family 4 protein [Rhodospirillales bacterium]
MNWGFIAGLFFGLSLCGFALTKAVIAPLRRRALVDLPNERSSHSVATPRGGGLAVIAVILAGIGICGGSGLLPVALSLKLGGLSFFLAALSWLDDLWDLGPLLRFGSHILAVAAALFSGLVSGPFFGGLVWPQLELVLIGIGWVWFINLFNFMDGIDGIAATETMAIGLGGLGLVVFTGGDPSVATLSLILIAAALGFLPHNWSPAKVFLGDVGSIPLGFLCAWVLLSLAADGQGAGAFILSLVFLSDATLTLFKRLLRREIIWHAHRQHFYQQAVHRGLSHAQVTTAACLANLALIGLALWSTTGHGIWAIGLAFLVIAILFLFDLKYPLTRPSNGTGS